MVEPDHAPSSFEYRSRLKVFGLPLVHVVRGIDPSSGRRPTAVGVIAVGQVAVGLVAVGQVAIGAISLGQASIGLGWGIGQLAFGTMAAGQVAAGLLGAVGQVAVAPNALGMMTDTGPFVAVGWLMAGVLLLSRRAGSGAAWARCWTRRRRPGSRRCATGGRTSPPR